MVEGHVFKKAMTDRISDVLMFYKKVHMISQVDRYLYKFYTKLILHIIYLFIYFVII